MEAKREDNINIDNIVQAGKALKTVVFLVLIIVLLALIGVLFVSTSNDIETIKNTYLILGFISLGCNVLILLKFYEAGDNLENAKSIKQVTESENPYSENETSLKTIKFVQYSTDKGIVEIAPCISLKGQKAFVNGQAAPDGKYKYGFMKYFHIENGIVIK
jgi:hypothetical protein